jgi:hypothetical protein
MITRAIQDAALAYAGAVQAAMRRAQAAYAANERSPAAQRNLRLAAAALVRSDAELAAAYTAHAQR